jgi:type 1 glutamine amidotransferase
MKTLLVTGANNHDWQRTAPFLADLLGASREFEVEVTEDPSSTLESDLSAYDLFFLDYNGPDWSEGAQSNFLAAVAAGTGAIVFHAADNAFKGWTEYEKLVGLMWREGTGHGQFHEFDVEIVDPNHLITAGLANFRTEDELYHRLVPMHGTPVHVLATAYSSPESGGTGNHEPVLMTTQYGSGRVFHTALGHVWRQGEYQDYRGAMMVAVENPGFQESLLRGCRWAARTR